jgi:competence protein ComEA
MKKLSLLFTAITFITLSFNTFVQAAEPPIDEENIPMQVQQQAININQAKMKDFTQLKGVGEKKAQAIIQYRQRNGAYHSLNDLLKVKGIGKKILIDNKKLLTI